MNHLSGYLINAKENNREKEHHLFRCGSCDRSLGRFVEYGLDRVGTEFQFIDDRGAKQHVETETEAPVKAEACCRRGD